MNINTACQSHEKKDNFFYGFIIVIAASIVLFLAYGIRTSFGVFFKPIEAEFHWSRTLISGASTVAIIVQGLWGIYMGRISDRKGLRRVVTICCFFLGTGSILMAATDSSWKFYLFYGVLIGLGMGGVYVAILSAITKWFIKLRGLMTGIVLAGCGIGTLTVAPAAGWMISKYGWRMSSAILGAATLIIGISAAQFFRKDPEHLGLKPYGQTEKDRTELPANINGLSLREAVTTWQFRALAAVIICLGYCTFVVNTHLVPHITDLGIADTTAAAILGVTGAVQSLGGIVIGLVSDKAGNRKALVISFILVSTGLFWLIPAASVPMFYLVTIIYSLGIGGCISIESLFTAELFGMKSNGVILGTLSFCFSIGASLGPVITGYLYDRLGNYNIAFLITAATGILALILATLLKPVRKSGIRTYRQDFFDPGETEAAE